VTPEEIAKRAAPHRYPGGPYADRAKRREWEAFVVDVRAALEIQRADHERRALATDAGSLAVDVLLAALDEVGEHEAARIARAMAVRLDGPPTAQMPAIRVQPAEPPAATGTDTGPIATVHPLTRRDRRQQEKPR